MIKYDIPMDFEVFAWYSNMIFQYIPVYSNVFQYIPYGVSKCFMFWTKPFAPTVPPIDDGPLFPETRHRLRGEILHDAQHVLTERHSLAYDRSIRCAWKRVEICRNGSYVSSMWVLCEFYVSSMWVLCEFYVSSMWFLCEFYVSSMWVLCEWVLCEFYVSSMWVLCEFYVSSMWVLCEWVLCEFYVSSM